ncbi:DUF1453 domain-containing protein [Kitasatospora sp. NPDC057223]|uniref:DUF1453 domain-containing protein n=1 Tax=Kitasatospora sp. NPDC057223 TaxID=3346055 RepID=UPI00364485E6
MAGLANLLVILAVAALVVGRQLRPQLLDTERRYWLLPLVLAVVALRDPRLVDPAHTTGAVALLAASLLVVAAMGTVWGWTVRLWHGADGRLRMQGTRATVAAWIGLLAVRAGLFGLGAALHVHQGTNALLLSLGALLLVRGAVVNWRARTLAPAGGPFAG